MRRFVVALATTAFALSASAQTYPVDIDNCFQKEHFEAPPRRPIVNDANMVQTILDLGLADRFVGFSGIAGVEKYLVAPPDLVKRLPQFTDRYPTLEAILGEHPDFYFAGWNYGFAAGRGVTPDSLAPFGVKTYTLRESCIRIGPREPLSLETLYTDLRSLGAIFDIRERADRMIAETQQRVEAVQARLAGIIERPRVMSCHDCNTTNPPLSVGKEGMTSLLIRLAGGENIFDDIQDSYVRVSWEEVARRNPQWILVRAHRLPVEDIIAHLTSDPQLRDVEAVRLRHFIFVTYAEQTVSTRNIDGLEKMARAFHPERFEPQ